MTEFLRTPDARFEALPDFPFPPHYLDALPGFDSLRMHYVDAGPPDAATTFLCVHGEPTWAFLFRRMIPVFTAAGHRVVAPDMFGFGRSDKPVDDAWYTFERHRDSLLAFVDALDLRDVCLVCQDWGGLLGLTLPMARPERFTRLLVMNTTLGTGDVPLTEGFLAWRAWTAARPDMEVGKLLGRACRHLSPGEQAAYDAPFPDGRYKAGVRRFPELVPDGPDAPGAAVSRQARDWLSNSWQGESFFAVGMTDPVLGAPVMAALRAMVRGAPLPLEMPEAGHFVQEWGEPVARAALARFFP
ncbi:MAG: alpha/beta fold hydrolase [Betaproteobacteria bacterium]|nr:alpha/beta fold hydrolase [Betaproteobacteria bacterium]